MTHFAHALPRWTLVLTALLVAGGISFIVFEEAINAFFTDRLGDDSSFLFTAGLIISALAADILLPVPSSLLGVAAGVKLGFWPGFASVWIGLTLGGLVGYSMGYGLSAAGLRRFIGEREYAAARSLAARLGVAVLALTRAAPLVAETAVLAAGIARMPLRLFLPALLLANTGVALVYTGLGAQAQASSSALLAGLGGFLLPALWWGFTRRRVNKQTRAGSMVGSAHRVCFSVRFDYPVHFIRSTFDDTSPILAASINPGRKAPVRFAVFVDANLARSAPALIPAIRRYASAYAGRIELAATPAIVAGGETVKNDPDLVHQMHKQLLELGLDRHESVLAIGGGAVLDAVGYAAATFHRGVRLIRMPSTVLAQNDAGVGVKNGINAFGVKNLVGCFAPPVAVINDLDLLDSLPERERRAGMAEAVKVALIRDEKFYCWIEDQATALVNGDREALAHLILRCAELHLAQIAGAGDPFESGSARPLDYGHWVAHKLEALSHHELRHGEAVAIGMALDARYAVLRGLLAEADADRIEWLLKTLGFDLWHPSLDLRGSDGRLRFLAGLEEFRTHLGGHLSITLLTGLGACVEVHELDEACILAACNFLRSLPHHAPFPEVEGDQERLRRILS